MTKQEYQVSLELIVEYMPHYILLPDLKKGYSKKTVRYMKLAMSKVVIPEKDIEKKTVAPENKEYRQLQIKKSKFFTDRAKESNKFHAAINDEERKRISQNIRHIQADIEQLFFAEAYFKQNGNLPEEKSNIPDDPIELILKRNSCRASISRYRSRLNALALLAENHPDREKIEGFEQKLRTKQLELESIQKSIEARGH